MALSGRASVLAAGAALALAATPLTAAATGASAGAAVGGHVQRISTDPYTNPTSAHRTEVEPDSFAWGSTVVTAMQVGRFYNGGASNIGWATSTDGGRTWRHGFLPRTTVFARGPFGRASDVSVAYDARHRTWMLSYLVLEQASGQVTGTDLFASRSGDGLHWDTPVVVRLGGPVSFIDKNWTACDNTAASPFYGHCYTEFDNAGAGNKVLMSTSRDGGRTWSRPATTAGPSHVIGGQPVALANGTVVVPIIAFSADFQHAYLAAFTSTDGGRTWSVNRFITELAVHTPRGRIRAGLPLPTAEVDRSGRVYVVWDDCRFESGCPANDLVMTTSVNGRDWSAVRRIPLDGVGSGVDHFVPGLAVDRTTGGRSAHLALTYYYYPDASCSVTTCRLEVGVATSTTGGATWSHAVRLAGPMRPTWFPLTTQGYMFGDYISTSIVPATGMAIPVFSAASPPAGEQLDAAIYAGRLRVTGGSLPAIAAAGSPAVAAVPGSGRIAN